MYANMALTPEQTPGHLLDAQDVTIQEASIGMLNVPRDPNILQTYAVVPTQPSNALEFDGLVPLLQQRQPAHPDSLVVGFLTELANYGSLAQLLR